MGGAGGSFAYGDTATGIAFAVTKNRLTADFSAVNAIAGTDAEDHQSDQQSIGAGRDPNRVSAIAVLRDFTFKRLHLRTEDEVLRFDHAVHGCTDLVANRGVLSF